MRLLRRCAICHSSVALLNSSTLARRCGIPEGVRGQAWFVFSRLRVSICPSFVQGRLLALRSTHRSGDSPEQTAASDLDVHLALCAADGPHPSVVVDGPCVPPAAWSALAAELSSVFLSFLAVLSCGINS